MTVSELVDYLGRYPAEMEVVVERGEGRTFYEPLEGVGIHLEATPYPEEEEDYFVVAIR